MALLDTSTETTCEAPFFNAYTEKVHHYKRIDSGRIGYGRSPTVAGYLSDPGRNLFLPCNPIPRETNVDSL